MHLLHLVVGRKALTGRGQVCRGRARGRAGACRGVPARGGGALELAIPRGGAAPRSSATTPSTRALPRGSARGDPAVRARPRKIGWRCNRVA